MISTARRLEYAKGYLALGLVAQAAAELDSVAAAERLAPNVMAVQLEVHLAANQWEQVADLARRLVALDRDDVGAWIALGCAVRRTESIAAARDLLLAVESIHGATHAVIHYNLACYHCLLGDRDLAAESLARACKMDADFDKAAHSDPDLQTLWDPMPPAGSETR